MMMVVVMVMVMVINIDTQDIDERVEGGGKECEPMQ